MMRDGKDTGSVPIAVVGVSALYPGSTDARGFWRDILAGRDLVTDVPPTHWLIEDYYDPDPSAPDKTYGKRGAFLPFVEFDPREFGIPPSSIPATDTSQLLALIVAKQVLEDALEARVADVDRSRVSVILGVASTTELVVELGSRLQRPIWVNALRESGLPEEEVQAVCDRIAASYVPWTEASFPGLLGNVVAGRIANRFDLGGTNCVIDAACASSLSALHLAMLELRAGTSDLVITGGVDTLNDILMYECFSKTPALSPSGDCRPFSAGADGTILGEGLGMLALRRLDDAEAAGEHIYAVIRGVGTSSDGRTGSVYAPAARGQARALERAYAAAGYAPATVELVEAHGTGTRAGDAAEFEGLRTVFAREGGQRRQWCALGSIKSQIGHTKAAAGAAGLFKVVMALHHKVLPPTIKVDAPNPALDLESSPFHLNTRARPWIRDASHPRRASVSSFGFGGSNYHVTVEEYRGPGRRPGRLAAPPSELVLLGEDSVEALARRCRGLAAEPLEGGGAAHHAWRTQQSFDAAAPHRLAVVASAAESLRAALLDAAERVERGGDEPFALPSGVYRGVGPRSGKVAFLFPGQGSQRVGMGADLAMAFDAAREVWDGAASAAFGADGVRLHDVVFPPPAFTEARAAEQEARLTATEWAQPALGATSLATLAVLQRVGLVADVLGGHSFGELTALAAAGVLSSGDLLRAARRRGELMASAAAVPGAMTAVSGPVGDLAGRIREAALDVTLANYNGPRQVVCSGSVEAIVALERSLDAEPTFTHRRLPVSTAFHSPLVAGSVGAFRAFLDSVPFADAALPVYSNVSAAPYPRGGVDARDLLAAQIASPVRFAQQVEAMYDAGVRVFVEVGPGSVLTGMVEQILAGRPAVAVATDRRGQDGISGLWHCLGRLAAAGVPVAASALQEGYVPPADPSEHARGVMSVRINGANYGRPYPPAGGAAARRAPNPPKADLAADTRAGSVAQGSAAQSAFAAAPLPAVAPSHPDRPVSPTVSPSAPAPPSAALAPPALPAPADVSAVVEALRDLHRELAAAQTAYQQAMAESHMLYLQTMASGASELAALTGATAAGPGAIAGPGAVASEVGRLTVAVAPPPPAPTLAADAWPTPSNPAPGSAPAPPPKPAPEPNADPRSPGRDLRGLLLEVVAEKTGYPEEVLDLGLELEAGLGVDSIKRVEILSAFRDRAPELPEVELSRLASLRTLGEILAFMEARAAEAGARVFAEAASTLSHAPPVRSVAVPAEEPPTAAAPAAGAASAEPVFTLPSPVGDLRALLVEVVAEKTGYPEDVLDFDVELEAGLGVDSIKRVEILSAFRERAPHLPEVELSRLAGLRTLGEILELMTSESAPPVSVGVASAEPAVQRLARFVPAAVPAPPRGFATPGLLDGSALVAITGGDAGVAQALAQRLRARGASVVVADAPPAGTTGVIELSALRAFQDESQAIAANRAVLSSARAVAAAFAERGGFFVTVQDTGGDFGLSGRARLQAWSAGAAALARTAGAEWPNTIVKSVDVEVRGRPADAVADAIAAELLFGGPEVEVALSAAGDRTTLVCPAAPAPAGELALVENDVVVASGGARGVTAACLMGLARRVRLRFVLLGRVSLDEEPRSVAGASNEAQLKRALLDEARARGHEPTPRELAERSASVLAAREVRATLQALEAAGSEARYLPVDVGDGPAVSAALEEVRRSWGPVAGVVHGAGVLADSLIEKKTDAHVGRVFRAKVGGLRNLLHATAGDPLEVLCLFSSVASRVGNPGQSDYAMANEILSKVAAVEAAQRPECVVRSIAWGPWEGGMVSPVLRDHFRRSGVALIPPDVGASAFVEELRRGGSPEVVLGTGPLDSALGSARRPGATMEVLVDASTYPELTSHRIEDVPVLPVVIALEWFVRAVEACHPGPGTPRIRDLRVLKGVRLERFHAEGDRFVLEVSDAGRPGALDLRLRGVNGVSHYSAVAELAPDELAPLPPSADLSLVPWTWQAAHVYDGKLFHGPDFQAIRDLRGVSERGASAVLAGASALGWNHWRWRTDPVALDGALQLARLWGIHALGRPSLPTRIGSVTLHASEPSDAPIHCTLLTRSASDPRTVSDIALHTESGTPIAELRDVEMHRLYGSGD